MWKKYRKIPVVVEAVRWWPDDKFSPPPVHPYKAGISKLETYCPECGDLFLLHGEIRTLEGVHIVCPGDYIVKGIEGECYPVKPSIFEKTYEEVTE